MTSLRCRTPTQKHQVMLADRVHGLTQRASNRAQAGLGQSSDTAQTGLRQGSGDNQTRFRCRPNG